MDLNLDIDREKLDAVLAHKFWFFFVLAFALPLVAWWNGVGELQATIEDREETLERAHASVRTIDPESPNQDWVDTLNEVNRYKEESLQASVGYLWDRQKQKMVWPERLRELTEGVPYWGPFDNRLPYIYGEFYPDQVDRVRNIVSLYDESTEQGNVVFPTDAMSPLAPADQWTRHTTPTHREVWAAQEDLWLFAVVLKAVARLNQGADRITEAPVREIRQLSLHGSGGEASGGGGTAGGSQMQGMAGPYGGSQGPGGTQGPGGPQGPRGPQSPQGGGGGSVSATFSPSAEGFGPASLGVFPNQSEEGADQTPAGGTADPAPAARYIDNEPDMAFKTRGFYLEAVMDHRRLPDLLVELTNADWPIRIVRVHFAAGAQAGSGGGMSAGGMSGGGRSVGPSGGYPGAGPTGLLTNRAAEPPGGQTGGSAGTRQGTGGAPSSGSAYQRAMNDESIGQVAIAGLITIYRPPQDQDPGQLDESSAAGPQSADNATAIPGSAPEARPELQGEDRPRGETDKAPSAPKPGTSQTPAPDEASPPEVAPDGSGSGSENPAAPADESGNSGASEARPSSNGLPDQAASGADR